jgi:hypothetical protein
MGGECLNIHERKLTAAPERLSRHAEDGILVANAAARLSRP